GRQALDGGDARSVGLDAENGARLHRVAVQQDGAGTALAGVAADVGSGEAQVLAQDLDQETSRLDVERTAGAVHGQRDALCHGRDLLASEVRVARRFLVASRAFRIVSLCPRDRNRAVGGGTKSRSPGLLAGAPWYVTGSRAEPRCALARVGGANRR